MDKQVFNKKRGNGMKLPLIFTRRALIAGATMLSFAISPLSGMAADVKVSGLVALPVDQQWINRIQIALDATKERGYHEYVYAESDVDRN